MAVKCGKEAWDAENDRRLNSLTVYLWAVIGRDAQRDVVKMSSHSISNVHLLEIHMVGLQIKVSRRIRLEPEVPGLLYLSLRPGLLFSGP